MPFVQPAEVVVQQTGDQDWIVREALRYEGKQQAFDVPVGADTDFASVPRVFVWFLPRYGRYTRAAILHDRLWRHVVPTTDLTYLDADGIFRRAMREDDVPFLARWIMWGAVRWGALKKPGGREGWWREAPRVLLVTLLAVPIVAPPAVLIGLSLLAFFLLEALAYAALWVGRKLRPTEPDKDLNPPTLDFKSS